MTSFTIYELASGKILRWGKSNAEQPLAPTEGIILGIEARALYYHVEEGELVAGPYAISETTAEIKARLVARLAVRRWEVETGGVTVGGARVATDDRSKLMLFGASDNARRNPAFTTKWKGGDGVWFEVNAVQIIALTDAVFSHVQSCFNRETELAEEILASEAPGTLAPAVETFWPES